MGALRDIVKELIPYYDFKNVRFRNFGELSTSTEEMDELKNRFWQAGLAVVKPISRGFLLGGGLGYLVQYFSNLPSELDLPSKSAHFFAIVDLFQYVGRVSYLCWKKDN